MSDKGILNALLAPAANQMVDPNGAVRQNLTDGFAAARAAEEEAKRKQMMELAAQDPLAAVAQTIAPQVGAQPEPMPRTSKFNIFDILFGKADIPE